MSVTIELDPVLEAGLRHQAAKQGVDAATYIAEALKRVLGDPPGTEVELLQQINLGISSATWQQYHALVEKRRAETLSPEEHRSLIELSNEIEQANARRMGYVAELARLCRVPLNALMQQLGISPGSDA